MLLSHTGNAYHPKAIFHKANIDGIIYQVHENVQIPFNIPDNSWRVTIRPVPDKNFHSLLLFYV